MASMTTATIDLLPPPPKRKNKRGRAREADPINTAVSARIREARITAGLTQEVLASFAGVTFQQLQKYEKGSNRVNAGTLMRFAKATGRSIAWFYDEPDVDVPQQTRAVLELTKNFCRIEDPDLRLIVMKLAKSLARA